MSEGGAITVWPSDGLSSKVCLPACRLNLVLPVQCTTAIPCQLGLRLAQWNPEGGDLLGGLPTGPGYFGRVFLADRLPSWP